MSDDGQVVDKVIELEVERPEDGAADTRWAGNLWTIIAARGLTLRKVAKAAGISHSLLSQALNGSRNLSLHTTERVARALGLPALELQRLLRPAELEPRIDDPRPYVEVRVHLTRLESLALDFIVKREGGTIERFLLDCLARELERRGKGFVPEHAAREREAEATEGRS